MRLARAVLAINAIALALGAVTLGACGDDLGTPHVRPLPAPDGRPAVAGGVARSPRIANYKLTAKLDDANHRITATSTLVWTNSSGSTVTELPFHLYLNAFKNEGTVFMRASHGQHRSAIMSSTGWGWIDVTSIKIGGAEVRPNARKGGPEGDETVLIVPLTTPVAPGASIAVDFAFTAQLPEVFARTGHKGAFTMVGQWFPKIGVLVGTPGFERWSCEPFHLNTEFFADFGTYDVTLTVPQTHVVAATGVLTAAADNTDGTRTLTYRAEDVHDFAWMVDPYMEIIRGTAKVDGRDVEVRVYHRPPQREFAQRHLHAAIGTIEQMSALFVPYPWTIMSVIDPPPEAASGAGGMEYPTLVTTAGDSVYARPGIRLPEYVTIHEVGHNWFQGILASNEPEEGWLDEGVNEWADAVVMSRIYGEGGDAIDWADFSAELFRLRRALEGNQGDLPTPIATAAWAFADNDVYASVSYGKAMMALRTLENIVGPDVFQGAMGAYARAWQFKHPTGADLFAALSTGTGQDLSWFIGPAFHGVGAPELALRSATCLPTHPTRGVIGDGEARKVVTEVEAPNTGAYTCEVVIENTGTVPVPVDVDVVFADGTRQRLHWDGRSGEHWHRFPPIERSSTIVEVEIDPEHLLLLGDDPIGLETRMQPDSRASWRAAARVGFWTQTMMSVVGL
jgi:hypothetical protein